MGIFYSRKAIIQEIGTMQNHEAISKRQKKVYSEPYLQIQ